jgi:prolyl oligopeptidase
MFYHHQQVVAFANYMKDAVSVVKQYDYSGKMLREIQLPAVGTAGGLAERKDKTLYYSFTNYTTPGTSILLILT